MDAFARSLRSEIASFAFVVDAKDRSAESFYGKYGFRRLSEDSRRLVLSMTEIAQIYG